jgi:hypothetical protein
MVYPSRQRARGFPAVGLITLQRGRRGPSDVDVGDATSEADVPDRESPALARVVEVLSQPRRGGRQAFRSYQELRGRVPWLHW